jgi:hypothetical protein
LGLLTAPVAPVGFPDFVLKSQDSSLLKSVYNAFQNVAVLGRFGLFIFHPYSFRSPKNARARRK